MRMEGPLPCGGVRVDTEGVGVGDHLDAQSDEKGRVACRLEHHDQRA